MSLLVLVRHGESRWNQCNRFTGWVDVPLSENGVHEAELCARHCKQYDFSACFTSKLERAHSTAQIILSQQDRTGIFQHKNDPRYSHWIKRSNHCDGGDIPIFGTPLLNERYYGALQGMEKGEAERKYGKEKLLAWRRGFEERPPRGESLKDVYKRTHPLLTRSLLPRLKHGEDILLAGHGNTLRAIIKRIEGISDEDIAFVDLPEAKPIVYEYKKGAFTRVKGEYSLDRPLR